LGEGLLVELDRVLTAVLPRRLPAQRRGLRVAQGLVGALLQLGVEPHACLRALRPELDHVAQHALICIGPDRHRLDGLAGDLAEQLLSLLWIVHHGSLLLHLLFRFSSHRVSPYASPSGAVLTRRVIIVKLIFASRYTAHATVWKSFEITELGGPMAADTLA